MTLPNDDPKTGVNEPWRTAQSGSTDMWADHVQAKGQDLPTLGQAIQADFIELQDSLMIGVDVHQAMIPEDWAELSQLAVDIDDAIMFYQACQTLEHALTSGFIPHVVGYDQGQSGSSSSSISTSQHNPITNDVPAYSTGFKHGFPFSATSESLGHEIRNTHIRSSPLMEDGQGDRPAASLHSKSQASLDTSERPQPVSLPENPNHVLTSDASPEHPNHDMTDSRDKSRRGMATPYPYRQVSSDRQFLIHPRIQQHPHHIIDASDVPSRSQPIITDSARERGVRQDIWGGENLQHVPHTIKNDQVRAMRPAPLANPATEPDSPLSFDSVQPDRTSRDVSAQNFTELTASLPPRSKEQVLPPFDRHKSNPTESNPTLIHSDSGEDKGRSHTPSPVKGLQELAQWLETEQSPGQFPGQSPGQSTVKAPSPQLLPSDQAISIPVSSYESHSPSHELLNRVQQPQSNQRSKLADTQRDRQTPRLEAIAPNLYSQWEPISQNPSYPQNAVTTGDLGAITPQPSNGLEPESDNRPPLEKRTPRPSLAEPISVSTHPYPALPDTEAALEALAEPLYERLAQDIAREYRQFYGD